MLRLFRAVSLRERRAHVGRALLIVAGVATGIELMVAFDVMNASVVTGFRQTFMALADVFARAQRSPELIALLDTVFATKTRAEWGERFDRHELVWAPVDAIPNVVRDPQARALDAFAKIAHRSGEEIEVLLELGFGWEEIGALEEKAAIG